MPQRKGARQNYNKPKRPAPKPSAPREPSRPLPRTVAVIYGKPFIVIEDEKKQTFSYSGGAWVPYSMTIAQCREHCQVKELSQKVNRMTRYEIRCPEPTDA